MKKTDATSKLLQWYDRNARNLPWRTSPGDRKLGIIPNPYHVWLSEIMLQQTTVATVRDYYLRFISLWPRLEDLAAENEENVLKAWAGLGYYSRARNLKRCADTINRDLGGRFPETEAELQSLPGIGPYTAAAIASIAFDQRAIVVDGNVERVVSRLFNITTPLPASKPEIRVAMGSLTPSHRPGDFAQAVMDLGATICTPKSPACILCPWNEDCISSKQGTAASLPNKSPKKAKPTRYGAAFIAIRTSDKAVLLRKRPRKGLLAGMTEVPGTLWAETGLPSAPENEAPMAGEWCALPGRVRHTFTHFHLEVTVYTAPFHESSRLPDGCWWSPPDQIATEALPTIMRKIITHGSGN